MILVQWTFSSDPSLIPWWVGPSRSRKPWGLYWQPLVEQIANKVNDSIDEAAWLAGTKADSVLVAVVTPFFSDFEGKVVVLDGTAMVELVVPDEIASSRLLAEVGEYIESKSFEALDKVAKKLKTGPPVRRIVEEPVGGERVVESDQVSLIGTEYLGDGLLALVPPQMAGRNFVDAIVQVSEELGEHRLHGWRLFQDDTPESGPGDGSELFVELDFRGIDVPALLSVLQYNKENALVVIARSLEQVGPWLKKIEPLMQGVTLSPILAGRDGSLEWISFRFAETRGKGN
ncbi:hypothetical protein SK803_41430 [Lentzea sp. BCCO 10_0856]|uniref:Uncharacterized protein n=1 Tax=Lentzea miocenica TaxID=3095431 RepID=A0ABU4TET2_9PSEU|nr:hypothetical protein [Lentzea sp. BCCO 10_0856]MDX8036696.1 hypothetical protein [Lentzea sp. BCCO 10_0856]